MFEKSFENYYKSITYIKKKDDSVTDEMTNKVMLNLANFYLEQNKPERSDYAQKYEKLLQKIFEKNKEDIAKNLKEYRLKQSRAEKTKPYYIFTDAQMKDLLNGMPQTKEALLKIPGFGNIKV